MEEENLKNEIESLKEELKTLKILFRDHLHSGVDDTRVLTKTIKLEKDQYLNVGLGSIGTGPINNSALGTVGEQLQFAIAVGNDDGQTGFIDKVKNMQLDFLHQPNNPSKQSFITGKRDGVEGIISTVAGQNTATINGYNFITNELANAIVVIQNSSGVTVEAQVISSNTSNQITISSTWGNTTNGRFLIYFPLFLGSAEYIWQRFYTQEGTNGGIRFGIGPTAGGKNGLLYMDAIGDLYWRNKSGTATKLN